MHTGFPWTQVIRDGKGAAPGRWCYRTVQGAEERQSVRVGDRQNWNFRWCRSRIFHVEAFRARSGANTGSQRVTGVKRQVGNRPSLRTCFVSPCALRVYVACKIAVVARIRIDDAANSAMLCSDLGLDPAKRISVAHDDDLAAHIDAMACDLLVVLLITIVGVYEFTGHIAIYGISVIDRQLFRSLPGSGVFLECGLFELCDKFLWRGHFQDPRLRRREEYVESFDRSIEAPRTKEARDVRHFLYRMRSRDGAVVQKAASSNRADHLS